MKSTKLMLSAFVAVLAFASCNKMDSTPEVSTLKTVEISLKDILFTKAQTDAFLTSETKVNLKDFKIFLTDGTSLIQAGSYGSTTPTYYYSISDGASLPEKATIHFVPANVSKVVVVGNVGSATFGDSLTELAALKSTTVNIEDEQDYKELTLYGEASLTAAGNIHNHDDGKTYNLYQASVKLAPIVARFELDGFAMVFNANPTKFSKVEVKQVALNNYYQTSTLNPLTPATVVDKVGTVTDVKAFEFFDNNLTVTGNSAWFYDALPAGDVVLDRAAATGNPLAATDDMATKKSYHFFPGTAVPQLFIELEVFAGNEVIGSPSYIYSKSFKTTAGDDVTFQPGYVYRMNFKGTAQNGDGDLPFNDDDINELDKCLEITVDVVEWQVVTVYPEF